jgi:hypothetical protein
MPSTTGDAGQSEQGADTQQRDDGVGSGFGKMRAFSWR